ncbi:high mobility group B protein 14 isoform X2 [Mercurialis annua]|uniref:high mobility group B protein 14 isoform X2 n=1 Tax=Mercurialis annua TaxID=3986 RepID=UPI00215F0D68|nr:high mobility group B protein 14 isoform X2 [Mercurialis annua]
MVLKIVIRKGRQQGFQRGKLKNLMLRSPRNRLLLSSTSCMEDFRKDFQEQNPNVKSMREIGKACGEKWKTMTYEEKVKYYDIATQKRAVFDKATAEYNKKMESGEFDEIVDDSDFDE